MMSSDINVTISFSGCSALLHALQFDIQSSLLRSFECTELSYLGDIEISSTLQKSSKKHFDRNKYFTTVKIKLPGHYGEK